MKTATALIVGPSRLSPSDRAIDTAIVCEGEIVAECFGRSDVDRHWNSRALAERLVKRDAAHPKLVEQLKAAHRAFSRPQPPWESPEHADRVETLAAISKLLAEIEGGSSVTALPASDLVAAQGFGERS